MTLIDGGRSMNRQARGSAIQRAFEIANRQCNDELANYTGLNAKRVGHADRDRYVDHLSNMVAEGYLTQDEFYERRDAALQAQVQGQLDKTVTDLPGVPGKKMREVRTRYNIVGERYHPKAWASVLVLSLGLIFLPGPMMSHAWGGFYRAPGSGILPLLLTMLGVILFIIGGICMAPSETKTEYVSE